MSHPLDLNIFIQHQTNVNNLYSADFPRMDSANNTEGIQHQEQHPPGVSQYCGMKVSLQR